jgi:hypothetical protein
LGSVKISGEHILERQNTFYTSHAVVSAHKIMIIIDNNNNNNNKKRQNTFYTSHAAVSANKITTTIIMIKKKTDRTHSVPPMP